MTVCCDFYNQTAHDDVCFTLRAAMEHGGNDAIPCVLRGSTAKTSTTNAAMAMTRKSDDERHDGLL